MDKQLRLFKQVRRLHRECSQLTAVISQPERITLATQLWTRPNGQKDIVYPFNADDSEDREEFVFRVQGYVLRANLPPITREDQ